MLPRYWLFIKRSNTCYVTFISVGEKRDSGAGTDTRRRGSNLTWSHRDGFRLPVQLRDHIINSGWFSSVSRFSGDATVIQLEFVHNGVLSRSIQIESKTA